jgi:hypothetical protein
MDLTNLVDVAIGLALVYLGASLFVTIINEYIGQLLQLRGRQLAQDLKTLIDDSRIQQKLKASPAFQPFFEQSKKWWQVFKTSVPLRSYVDPNVLARMIVGGLETGQQTTDEAKTEAKPIGKTGMGITEALEKLPNSNVKEQLLALSKTVKGDVDRLVHEVSQWADRSLTMLGETYKRNIQILSFGLGILIAIAFNLDTITVSAQLYRDKDARAATSAAALELVRAMPQDSLRACLNRPADKRATLVGCEGLFSLKEGVRQREAAFGKLPIGWPNRSGQGIWQATVGGASLHDVPARLLLVLGWILTGLAISLGASFWFDALNKLVNVRHGMKPPAVEQERS